MGEEQPAPAGCRIEPAAGRGAARPPRRRGRFRGPSPCGSVAPRLRVLNPRVLSPRVAARGPGDLGDRGRHVRRLRRHLAVRGWCSSTRRPGIWASTPNTSSSTPISAHRSWTSGRPASTCWAITSSRSSPSWPPFFRAFPSAATLLIAQALLAAASVFPVSQLAREKLGIGPGRAIAFAYGFSWGLQQLAQFDFHEIAFAVPLLAFSLCALARGRIKAAVWWALPLVFVKEDQGFTVAAIGVYLIVAGLRARPPVAPPRATRTAAAGWPPGSSC